MKINGTDISTYNARLRCVSAGKRTISNSSEWNDNTLSPILLSPQFGLKSWQIVIFVYGDTRGEIWENTSKILALFNGVSEVTFDDFSHTFLLSLTDAKQEERTKNKRRWQTLTLDVVGCEYGDVVQKELTFSAAYAGNDTVTVSKTIDIRGDGITSIQNTVDIFVGVDTAQTQPTWSRPMCGAVTISGLCKNKYKKDIGDIVINCGEVTHVTIDGKTGITKGDYADADIEPGPGTYTVNLPSLPYVYDGAEKIKVSVRFDGLSNWGTNTIYLAVQFKYRPLLL